MGGRNSTHSMRYLELENNDKIVQIMMPVYYIKNALVTEQDIVLAKYTWSLITDDTSAEFLKMKGCGRHASTSCISWFFGSFYERLFDMHPLCKPLFQSGLQSQGKFLVRMISFTLNQLAGHEDVFKEAMHDLAVRHCERGIKAIEYGVVGDVLFWSIKKCIGADAFTCEVELVWHKVYSKMLQEIVPKVVYLERKNLHQPTIKRPNVLKVSSSRC